jgi:acyl-CoA reductase-like NAD-dependent aldehyde dehydrogenase
VETEASRSLVTFQPLGVVLAVMPWNFPFWQFFRFAAPALMVGKAGAMVEKTVLELGGSGPYIILADADIEVSVRTCVASRLTYDEALFGPVAALIAVPDEAEAIHMANDSVFGLGVAVFTQDKAKGERLAAQEREAGCCFVNTFVRSDPRLPFGDVQASGYGRELSHYGIKAFVNIETVYVQ